MGKNNTFQVDNLNNTNAASGSRFLITTGGASAGDPKQQFTVIGETNWSLGIDNSDNDAFVISNSATLGTNNALRIDQAGEICIGSGCP